MNKIKDIKLRKINEDESELEYLNYLKANPQLLKVPYVELHNDLNEKKIAIIDIYLFYSNEVNDLLNYSKIVFPSEELLNDLVNILEEIIDDVLDEI